MSAKQLPPPTGGRDLAAVLKRRHEAESDARVESPAATPARPKTAPSETTRAQEMDRRSWYLPKATADALTNAVSDVHWLVRQPKHAVLAAIIEVALTHLDEVEVKLRASAKAKPNSEPPKAP